MNKTISITSKYYQYIPVNVNNQYNNPIIQILTRYSMNKKKQQQQKSINFEIILFFTFRLCAH